MPITIPFHLKKRLPSFNGIFIHTLLHSHFTARREKARRERCHKAALVTGAPVENIYDACSERRFCLILSRRYKKKYKFVAESKMYVFYN